MGGACAAEAIIQRPQPDPRQELSLTSFYERGAFGLLSTSMSHHVTTEILEAESKETFVGTDGK